MSSSGMLHSADLVIKDVSEARSASTIRVTLSSSETSVLTRATRRNIPEDAILHMVTNSTYEMEMTDQLDAQAALPSWGSPLPLEGDWVGPITSLDAVKKSECQCQQGMEPRFPGSSSVYTD
jgi:hypothetical protein